MNLCIIGTGNIGLATGLCFAQKGHVVDFVDNDDAKITLLQNGQTSHYEPKIEILLQSLLAQKSINFTNNIKNVINKSEVLFITVGTPIDNLGHSDTSSLISALEAIDKCTESSSKTIIIKSTVNPNTTLQLSKKYKRHTFVSSPEFIREGSAIKDCLNPDRILIGSTNKSESSNNLRLFKEMYQHFNLKKEIFVETDSTTAELIKYSSNVFLAARISLINEFSVLAEKTGADIDQLQFALGLDPRIGNHYLSPGLGFGGSCLPKDAFALVQFGNSIDENLLMTNAIIQTNFNQLNRFIEKIINKVERSSKKICIWGTAFKPNTDDMRDSAALKIISKLIQAKYKIHLYDPKCSHQLSLIFKNQPEVSVFTDAFEALKNADALVVCTEWDEFINADLTKIKTHLNSPVVFDGRRIFKNNLMRQLGFDYYSIGTKYEPNNSL